MFETIIYSVVIMVLISISILFIVLANKIRIENNRKQYELQSIQNKEREEIKQKEHNDRLSKGFKLYEWRSYYTLSYTEIDTWHPNFGDKYRKRFENEGKDYFRNEEELRSWVNSKNEVLTFCREI